MMQPKGSILELCQVVRDMDSALDHWTRVMGAGPFFVFDVPVLPGQIYRGEPTQVAMKVGFGFSGGLLIELLQQTNDGPSVFTEMLDRHGDGYHHVMLRVPYDEGVERLSREGYAMAFSGTMPSGERFALFDTRSGNGGYVELMEMSPAIEASLERMHTAHQQWDGVSRPVRSMAELA
ncbi:VOC family protein [Sphingobium sp. CFD-1]|uniref:Methylmalonyl-CoA mutase n=2 Tax=Sphingobium baderi TaxID=1332080 RepID=A0A0S3F250_9SPHN|nr:MULTISPECIES: VOC family protein [Sphingobium]ALR21801.1 methylmalonyl-CoA mutase [Sphingobium baderi]